MGALSFLETMLAAGLTPPNIIEPEKFYRFPGANKRSGNSAGWCRLFAGGLGGVYGDFSQDLFVIWQAKRTIPYTATQQAKFNRQIAETKTTADGKKAARQSRTAAKAALIWQDAQPATNDHAYLIRKGVDAHGARLQDGALVIPMLASGVLLSPTPK